MKKFLSQIATFQWFSFLQSSEQFLLFDISVLSYIRKSGEIIKLGCVIQKRWINEWNSQWLFLIRWIYFRKKRKLQIFSFRIMVFFRNWWIHLQLKLAWRKIFNFWCLFLNEIISNIDFGTYTNNKLMCQRFGGFLDWFVELSSEKLWSLI